MRGEKIGASALYMCIHILNITYEDEWQAKWNNN